MRTRKNKPVSPMGGVPLTNTKVITDGQSKVISIEKLPKKPVYMLVIEAIAGLWEKRTV